MTNTPHAIDIIIGQNIRKLRRQKGISQAALGKALSAPITFQQIQKYEIASNRVAGSRLVELAEILGVRVEKLFEGTREHLEAGLMPIYQEYDRRTAKLHDDISKLPEPLQSAMRNMASTIAKGLANKLTGM